VGVDAGKHVNLLILLVEQFLQLAYFSLQEPYSLLQRFGVPSGKGTTAELIAGLTLEADVGALGAARTDAIAAYLLGATAVACLGNAGLAIGADFNHFHGQDSGHDGG
jgi:hypothetical protein